MIKRKFPKLKFAIFGFLVLLLALSPVTPVFAQDVGLGHGFYGTVEIGDGGAEIGSVISAQIDGTECGSCQVATLGQYALIVQGSIDDGATIDFYINFQPADQTFPFHDGWTTQLDLTVAEAEPVTVNVIVEGQTSTIWSGEVTFQNSTITDKQGVTHTIGHPTALGALDEAAKAGGFTYVVSSEWGPLGFVEEIAGDAYAGAIGWLYTVNGVSPMVAAVDYPLNNDDEVLWYYGAWDEPYVRPVGDTNAASAVTTSRATLNGNLGSLGTALSVDVSFEWGTTTAYGRETTVQTMTSTGSFNFSLSGLSDGATYHFRAKAVGDGTGYGTDMSFTTSVVYVGPGVGAAPPELPPGTTDVSGKVTVGGRFTRSVTATSEDELCTLTIPKDTVGLTEELEPLDEITVLEMDEPPPPPKDAHVVGLAYDFGPDGATFDPAITLTWSYDLADIPEGVAEEDLVIAYYEAGEWVELEGCVVDPVTKTITAPVSHFTTFAVIARRPVPPPPAPAPAAFSVSDLTIQPIEVEPKEAVTITVSVANTGGTEGSYSLLLLINRVKEAEKSVTIAAGESQVVSFSVSKEEARTYSVVVDGLSGFFTVVGPVLPPTPPPPAPVPVPEVKPFNWPLVGGIIGGVVVVGLLVFFFVIRPRIKEY